MSDQPAWPTDQPGPEALFKGDKGDKGEPGPAMTSGAKRAFLMLALLIALVAVAALVVGTRAYDTLQTRQLTQCQFNHDLGDLAKVKVTINPATHKASKVGIAIIADSRAAFRGLGCSGQLDKPGKSFTHWAHHYGLPAT